MEETSNAMALDGIMFEGVSVRVRRPTDYNPVAAAVLGPSEPANNLNVAAIGLQPGGSGMVSQPAGLAILKDVLAVLVPFRFLVLACEQGFVHQLRVTFTPPPPPHTYKRLQARARVSSNVLRVSLKVAGVNLEYISISPSLPLTAPTPSPEKLRPLGLGMLLSVFLAALQQNLMIWTERHFVGPPVAVAWWGTDKLVKFRELLR